MRLVAWLVPSLFLSGLCAWLSVELQQAGMAPLGIHSVAIGGTLGVALVGLAALTRLPVGRAARVSVCLLAFNTSVLQHVAGYMEYCASFHRVISIDPRASWAAVAGELQPAGFLSYIRARTTPAYLLLWGLDTLLITLTGSVTFMLGSARLVTRVPQSPPGWPAPSAATGQIARGGRDHIGKASSLTER